MDFLDSSNRLKQTVTKMKLNGQKFDTISKALGSTFQHANRWFLEDDTSVKNIISAEVRFAPVMKEA